VVVLGDGAPWIWNLAEVVFPRRVEILDWYHASEHVSAAARTLYGEGTAKAAEWRHVQIDRLWTDGIEQVIEALRFLGAHQRTAGKRQAVADLARYLTTNRERIYGMRRFAPRATTSAAARWRAPSATSCSSA
jgi:hypothetical protein